MAGSEVAAITIRPTAVLAYYDGLEVFAGEDAASRRYIGSFVGEWGDCDRFVVVGVQPERLTGGEQCLRSLFPGASRSGWYLTLAGGEAPGTPFVLEPQVGDLEAHDFLPGPGFMVDCGPDPVSD